MPTAENLVFLPDSPYSEWIIKRCEELFPGFNKYLLPVEDLSQPTRVGWPGVLILKNNELDTAEELQDLSQYKRVIVNYHTPFIGHFLNQKRNNLAHSKLIWIIWSGDLYKHSNFLKRAYTPLTLSILPLNGKFRALRQNIHHRMLQLFGKPNRYTFERSFSRFDVVGSFFEKDTQAAREVLGVNAKWIRFAFLSLEELFAEKDLNNKPNLGNKIMVGHSGSPENNHLDVYQKLHQLLPQSDRIILSPLSYGNPKYLEAVKTKGIEFFGDRFESLEKFIPREVYYNKLSEVSIAIFNHKIQQAFGNILGLIFMGAKVFLNPENPVYIELTRVGIQVFDYSQMKREDLDFPLPKEMVLENRELLRQIFNEEKIRGFYKDIFLS